MSSDVFDPDPQYLQEAERFAARDAEQAEWELDPTRIMPPRPRKAHKASRSDWARYRKYHAGASCQVGCGEPATELHHILPRDGAGTWPSGDDFLRNLAPLCRDCHRLVEARDMATRTALRERLTDRQLAYLSYRIGPAWRVFLERHYPMQVAA